MDPLGIYLKQLQSCRIRLPRDEETELARRKDVDPSARRLLIESQLPYVVKLARSYADRGLPLLDLIQVGNHGLVKAVDKFDANQGVRLTTYATYAVKQHIERHLWERRSVIKVPSHVRGRDQRYSADADRAHAVESLAVCEGLDQLVPSPCLLQAHLDEDERSYQADLLHRAIESLPPADRDVIRRRMAGETLLAIGTLRGVTRERVRQLEMRARERLRRALEQHIS